MTSRGPTLVLGSTQPAALVDATAVGAHPVEVARRRGGGGAVYLSPGEQLWLDVWIPRDDPLWVTDVSTAAEWVGAWWAAALAGLGLRGLEVHQGRALPGDWGDLVCFAGRGPGEVFHAGRKVVGLSQWRAREGALFSSCAYLRWDPAPLLALLNVGRDERSELARGLASAAIGLADVLPGARDLALVRGRAASFAVWLHGDGAAGRLRRPAPSLFAPLSLHLFALPPAVPGLKVHAPPGRRYGAGGSARRAVRTPPRRAPGRRRRPGGFSCVAVGSSGCDVREKGLKWRAVV